jgi:hypothetical protein
MVKKHLSQKLAPTGIIWELFNDNPCFT